MADIKVTQEHSFSVDEAKTRVGSFETMLKKYMVKVKWSGAHADLKGTGVSGSIDVTESNVSVVVKLGMLAKAAGIDVDRLKGSIAKRLQNAFEE